MVKCLPEFEYFTVFLKNKNIIFKIRRSKVTDYGALSYLGERYRLDKPLASNTSHRPKMVLSWGTDLYKKFYKENINHDA